MLALIIPWKWQENYEKILEFQKFVGWEYSFDIKDFILVITIWAIMFTLLVKATTISYIMKKMWITKLHPLEEFEYDEAKIIANIKILKQLNKVYDRWYLSFDEYSDLKNKYEQRLSDAIKELNKLLEKEWKNATSLIKRAVLLYALWIEKDYLKELFEYNEVKENNFKIILRKISRQIERLEVWNYQFSKEVNNNIEKGDIFERIKDYVTPKAEDHINKYRRNRARVIITRRVIKELNILKEIEFGFDSNIIKDTIKIYEGFQEKAKEKMENIKKQYKSSIMVVESNLTNKTLIKIEEWVIGSLYKKEIITPKTYLKFKEEIEKAIEEDIKKIY
jgi:ElaB/YqjD/DUF883 family membrane-anchored ribosome-binding protein